MTKLISSLSNTSHLLLNCAKITVGGHSTKAEYAQFGVGTTIWSAVAERFSASDLCSDGRVARMCFRTPTATVVLMSLSKTLYHNCFSPPRSKMGTCEGSVGCCVWLALYAPKWQQLSCMLPRKRRWFQEWYTVYKIWLHCVNNLPPLLLYTVFQHVFSIRHAVTCKGIGSTLKG